jgi:hypothetical protein
MSPTPISPTITLLARRRPDDEPDGTIDTQTATIIAGLYACAFTEDRGERSEDDIETVTGVAADVSDYLLSTGTFSAMTGHKCSNGSPSTRTSCTPATLTLDQLPDAHRR